MDARSWLLARVVSGKMEIMSLGADVAQVRLACRAETREKTKVKMRTALVAS